MSTYTKWYNHALIYKKWEGRLIFYEDELNPLDENKFDIENRNIKLKFEVRLTRFSLHMLADHIDKYKTMSDFGISITDSVKDDSRIIPIWSKYNNKVSELISDTEEVFPQDKFKELPEITEDLVLRANNIVKKDTNQNNNNIQKGDSTNA